MANMVQCYHAWSLSCPRVKVKPKEKSTMYSKSKLWKVNLGNEDVERFPFLFFLKKGFNI